MKPSKDFNNIFKEVVNKDTYMIRDIKRDIDFVIDIGANIGVFSLYSRIMFPDARIIAIEPEKTNFVHLTENLKGLYVDCENAACGDGRELYFRNNGSNCGQYTFEDKPIDEKSLMVRSISLKDIFKKYNFKTDKNYIIKSDCEGGERFLLNDYKDIIGKCKHFCMEIHFPNPRHKQFDKFPSYMEYYNWVQTFSHTHKITYHHSRKKSGIGVYVLSRYI
jgi:FkbM family methyltransferase